VRRRPSPSDRAGRRGSRSCTLSSRNDLTQTALGLSRDDAEGKFLTGYIEPGVVEHSPFETLDRVGVGELTGFGVKRSRVSGVECPASASVCE
jgi:hypothetical protein